MSDILHDRISDDDRRFLGLVREHHRVEVDLNDPHQGTYRSHVGGLLGIIDRLAETTVAPEARQYLAEVIGEAVHTALRKACDSDAASRAHAAIRDLPDDEWRAVTDWAADAALALHATALAAAQPVEPPVTVCASCGEARDDVLHCSDCYSDAEYGPPQPVEPECLPSLPHGDGPLSDNTCAIHGRPWPCMRAQPVEPEPDEREVDCAEQPFPTEEEAAAIGIDLMPEHRSLHIRGVVHRISLMPNHNYTGWIIGVESPSELANLPQEQAIMLGRILLAGPGRPPYPACEHGARLRSGSTTEGIGCEKCWSRDLDDDEDD